jgi:hypothetical protein
MDSNGGGVIFAGSSSYASGDNVVEKNVITRSDWTYNVTYWWETAVGTGNVLASNCVWKGYSGDIDTQKGFTATGNVAGDPRYVDVATRDYRMAADSPCLALVGYDIAAKVNGLESAPAGTPSLRRRS